MPITKSAIKALRASKRKHVYNLRRARALSEASKEVRSLVKLGKQDEALAQLPKAYQAIDKAAKRGIIKPNTAGRKKSGLAKLFAKAK